MSKKKDPNSAELPFFEIKQSAMVAKILDVIQKYNIPIVLWLKDQSAKFDSRIIQVFHSLKVMNTLMPADINHEEFQKTIDAQNSLDIFGSFQVDAMNFFFKAHIVRRTELNYLQIDIPDSLFKLQRRANLRIPFNRTNAPKMTVIDPLKDIDENRPIMGEDLLAYRVLDVSGGGLSFAAPIEDQLRITLGLELRQMSFKIRGSEILTNGVVRYTKEMLNDQGKPMIKVGVKFVGLKAMYEKTIVQFVLDESRKLFSLLH